jgi:hypothetical protein
MNFQNAILCPPPMFAMGTRESAKLKPSQSRLPRDRHSFGPQLQHAIIVSSLYNAEVAKGGLHNLAPTPLHKESSNGHGTTVVSHRSLPSDDNELLRLRFRLPNASRAQLAARPGPEPVPLEVQGEQHHRPVLPSGSLEW